MTCRLIIIIFLLFLMVSCNSKPDRKVKDGSGSFSYKDGHLAFTYFKNNVGSVYYTNHIDSVAKQLTFPKEGWDRTVDLSRDLSVVLYLNFPNRDYDVCSICLYDLRSGKTDTLLSKGNLIMDACLSNDNKHVYFLKASEIKNYSPIARKAPHGIDVYEINVQTRAIRQLTNLKAYSMQALAASFSDSLIMLTIMSEKNGIVTVSTNTGQITEVNFGSPRNDVREYFASVDIRQDSIFYEAPYELYKHNLKTDVSEFILRSPTGSHFGIIQADSSWTNILFNSSDKLYRYNLPSKNLTEVKLKIQ